MWRVDRVAQPTVEAHRKQDVLGRGLGGDLGA